MIDEPQSNRSRGPRFSLLSAILLMTIVGLSVVVVRLWREVGPLRTEVRELRDEVGRLSIDDSSRLHAIEVRTEEPRTWKWRVWVPEGHTALLHLQWGNVPQQGVPSPNNMVTLDAGEHWVTLSARRGEEGVNWTWSLATQGGSVGGMIQPEENWFDWKSTTAVGDGVNNTTHVAPAGQTTTVLKRYRVGQANNSLVVQNNKNPTAGFIVWLDLR